MAGKTILDVGAEGGSITLRGEQNAVSGEWKFWMVTAENAFCDAVPDENLTEFGSVSTTEYVNSLSEALTLLDRYPWATLCPKEINPRFRNEILAGVERRAGRKAVRPWKELPISEVSTSVIQEPRVHLPEIGLTVREIHIDFLLQEEFSSDPEFLRSFIKRAAIYIKDAEESGQRRFGELWSAEALIKKAGGILEVQHVRHSVSDQHGEADLVVIFKQLANPQESIALLIEDKIRAPFRPRQPERYLSRGKYGKDTGEWNQDWTVLVAPESYVVRGHGFHAAVTLEQVSSALSPSDPKRQAFKARVITGAINLPLLSGVRVVDPVMTAFRQAHFDLFKEYFKQRLNDVRIRSPAPTWWDDSWFDIRSPLLPRGVYISHKSRLGFVDLTFPKTNAELLRPIESILEAGMSLHQTHNSSAIRILVPPVSSYRSCAEEQTKVNAALTAAARLLDFYVKERLRLEPALRLGKTAKLV